MGKDGPNLCLFVPEHPKSTPTAGRCVQDSQQGWWLELQTLCLLQKPLRLLNGHLRVGGGAPPFGLAGGIVNHLRGLAVFVWMNLSFGGQQDDQEGVG